MSQKLLFSDLPLGRHLAIVTKLYFGALSRKLNHLELDRHYSVLIFVELSSMLVTQQIIGDYLQIDKASMVRVLDGLVEKGYLLRRANPEDRRSHIIELTLNGRKLLPEIHAGIKALNVEVMVGLNESEQQIFRKSLCVLTANLRKLPADEVVVQYHKLKD